MVSISQYVANNTYCVNGGQGFRESIDSKIYCMTYHTKHDLMVALSTCSFLDEHKTMGLPAEAKFGPALNKLREEGFSLVELEGISIDRRKAKCTISNICLRLLKKFYSEIKHPDKDNVRVITVVTTKAEEFFRTKLGFEWVASTADHVLMSLSWLRLSNIKDA